MRHIASKKTLLQLQTPQPHKLAIDSRTMLRVKDGVLLPHPGNHVQPIVDPDSLIHTRQPHGVFMTAIESNFQINECRAVTVRQFGKERPVTTLGIMLVKPQPAFSF